MTREEAIDLLQKYKEESEEDYYVRRAKALDMAIEVLEQQDKVLDAIKEIKDLFNQPAAYVPNYDAYGLCLGIICKHMEVEIYD